MKRIGLTLLSATVLFSAVGCGGTGDALIGNRNPRVRVVNAFPNQSVDASLTDSNGTQNVMANEPFGTVTQEFIPENGVNTVLFTVGNGGAQIIANSSLYELNKDYTVVGYGGVGNRNVLIASDAAAPLFNRAAFRVMNVSNAAVDVRTGTSGSGIGTSTQISNDLSSGSILSYQDIPAGNMRIFVTDGTGAVIHSSDDYTFESGKTYTIIVAQNPATTVFKINSF